MTPLQHHLTQRPEMPRPFHPDAAISIPWQRAMQWWVETKERLEIEERVAGVIVPAHDHNRPSCTPRADYQWRDIGGRKAPNPHYMAQKKAESVARIPEGHCRDCRKPAEGHARCPRCLEKVREARKAARARRGALIREGLMERRAS